MRFKLIILLTLLTNLLYSQITFKYQNQPFNQGDTVLIPFTVEGFNNLGAYQFSLRLDTSVFDFCIVNNSTVVYSGSLTGISSSWYGKPGYSLKKGEFRTNWLNVYGKTLTNGTQVFSLRVKAKASSNICQGVQLWSNNPDCYPIAYTKTFQVVSLGVQCISQFRKLEDRDLMVKVYPNPTSDLLKIESTEPLKVKVFNQVGSLIYEGEGTYLELELEQGLNLVLVNNKIYKVIKL